MLTASARRSDVDHWSDVLHRDQLRRLGFDAHAVDRQLAARRWQRSGPAVVLHNGPLSTADRRILARLVVGPRAVLTSFTAAEEWGLRGWEREDVHVLGPKGATDPAVSGLVLHRVGKWDDQAIVRARGLHRLAPALVIAASSFTASRPGCGLLAAAVQQRLASPAELRTAVAAASRTRHRHALLLSLDDIAQGAQALSEIDFVRLCRRHGLPEPARQAVRALPDGRRRYLDVGWDLPGGRRRAVEVDGAYHLDPRRWVADQLRQNDVVLDGTTLLRYPSIVVRDDEPAVVRQLFRLLT